MSALRRIAQESINLHGDGRIRRKQIVYAVFYSVMGNVFVEARDIGLDNDTV
jgi:hypothetical protein